MFMWIFFHISYDPIFSRDLYAHDISIDYSVKWGADYPVFKIKTIEPLMNIRLQNNSSHDSNEYNITVEI